MPDWKSISFGSFHLAVHPDLEVTIAKRNHGEFLLLGFFLNHRRPETSNQEILDELAETCYDVDQLHEYCRDLCGRYVILFAFPGKTGLLNDLSGSRSVYYCTHQGVVWCASQPNTLARVLEIEEDYSPAVRDYIERDVFTIARGERSWIGDGTKYVGIKHLLPNHYLDFEERKPIRYWPIHPPDTLDLKTASQISAAILENIIRAASIRNKLIMGVTGGWESRCLLAATKNVRSEMYYYIQKFGGMMDKHPDIWVPRKLAEKLGFPFHVIDCDDYRKDETFDTMLEENVFMLHNPVKVALYRCFYQDFQGVVNVSGNLGEITRTHYGSDPVHSITDLLEIIHLSHSRYASESLEDWYSELKPRCDTLGLNLRDLFHWEQIMGNWGSMFPSELDIAIEEFYPFGTRRLVETALAVDEKSRSYSNSCFYKEIIDLLWPELLSEPINPITRKARTIKWFKKEGNRALARLGLLSLVDRLRPLLIKGKLKKTAHKSV